MADSERKDSGPEAAHVVGTPAAAATDKLRAAKARGRRSNTPASRRVRQETGIGRKLMQELGILYPGDLKKQATALLRRIDPAAATGRARKHSHQSRKDYADRIGTFINVLGALNMRVSCLVQLGPKHVKAVIQKMEAEPLSEKYMRNILTVARRFLSWAGKPDAAPALEFLLVAPEKAQGSGVARHPRTLEALSIDPEVVFRNMDACSPTAGLLLRLMHHFGLRAKEATCFRPVRGDGGDHIVVKDGTKGGRERRVPIEHVAQRELLDLCKAHVDQQADAPVTAAWGLQLHLAMNRLYYLARRVGLTVSTETGYGVTMHGLRRSYAIRTYAELSGGVAAPVLGGAPLPRDLQDAVEKELAQRLGHNRSRIVAAYVGSHPTMRRVQRDRIEQTLLRFKDQDLCSELVSAKVTRLLAIGPAADGLATNVEVLAWEGVPGADPLALPRLCALLDAASGCRVTLLPLAMVRGDQSTLEVF
jgi:integrase